MRTGGRTALTARGACFAAGLTFLLGISHAESNVRVMISDHGVSIIALDTTIRDVLEELSQQSNLVVLSQDAVDDPVTVDIDQPTLPEAIRHLLRQKDFMIHQPSSLSGHADRGPAPYTRLWIFPDDSDNSQQGWTNVAPGIDDDGGEFSDYRMLALSHSSSDREEAMYGIGDIGVDHSVEFLKRGLSDPVDRVRQAAIDSLAEIGGTESVQALGIALRDPDASLRVDAVDALGEIGSEESIEMLQGAIADENPIVREAAAEWITELTWLSE
jgi:hypothetical protein